MSDPHIESAECICKPKVVVKHDLTIVLHRPVTVEGKTRRRPIFGLPAGWVIVGRSPSAEVMTEAQRRSEQESFDSAERIKERAARKESLQRRKRGL